MRFGTIAVSACALALLLGGTEARAQDHSHEGTPGEPLVIEVDMADHSFSPEALRIPAGQPVTLVFTNVGEVEHGFMAGRTVADGDFEVDLFAGIEVEIHAMEAADHAEKAEHEHEEAAEDHGHADAGDHGHADAEDHEHADAGDHGHADAGDHDSADGHHDDGGHGTMVLLDEGGRTSMTFTLPIELRGEWEMACFLPRHYERGMHGTLTVY